MVRWSGLSPMVPMTKCQPVIFRRHALARTPPSEIRAYRLKSVWSKDELKQNLIDATRLIEDAYSLWRFQLSADRPDQAITIHNFLQPSRIWRAAGHELGKLPKR